MQDFGFEIRTNTTLGHDIDRTAEQLFQFLLKPHLIQRLRPGLKSTRTSKSLSVALFPMRDGAKNTHPPDAVFRGRRQDGVALVADMA